MLLAAQPFALFFFKPPENDADLRLARKDEIILFVICRFNPTNLINTIVKVSLNGNRKTDISLGLLDYYQIAECCRDECNRCIHRKTLVRGYIVFSVLLTGRAEAEMKMRMNSRPAWPLSGKRVSSDRMFVNKNRY